MLYKSSVYKFGEGHSDNENSLQYEEKEKDSWGRKNNWKLLPMYQAVNGDR